MKNGMDNSGPFRRHVFHKERQKIIDYDHGAADARNEFKRYLRGLRKRFPHHQLMLDVLIAWITAQRLHHRLQRHGH